MIIERQIRGNDGIQRTWLWDTENNLIKYSGIASDFQDKVFTIGTKEVIENNNILAEDLIREVEDERS